MRYGYNIKLFHGSACRQGRAGLSALLAWSAMLAAFLSCQSANADARDYFVVQVVDEQTGRGVPLVELRTNDDVAYYTDSNGVAAFLEPGLMGRKVFFTVTSPGYEFAADGFGFHGTALQTTPGTKSIIKIKRINIAERLYRQTGAGIYRDSILAGIHAPLKSPLLTGDVVGQDSVLAVPYKGAIHWFWGDTSRPDYPLGNFGTTGAVSPLNSNPDTGIDFRYFTTADGFARAMIPIEGPGPVWISAVSTIENGSRLIGYYSRVEGLVRTLERGLIVYNDATDVFKRAARFDAAKPLPIDGHAFLASEGGSTFLTGTYGGAAPLPVVRVSATLAALKDLGAYETFTCLKAGADGAQPERDAAGELVFAWKHGAPCLTYDQQQKLVAAGRMKAEEGLFQLRDIETGKPIRPHGGSVYWNAYSGRWVMVFGQIGGGPSNLGEIWFAEADTSVGPWVYARKVATHPKMDFYNPTQHAFFDQENGRRIYFEGTYVNTFSGNPIAIPRYNYNQLMYRLSLDDPRLSLPLPVYRLATGDYRTRDGLKLPADAAAIRSIPFYAIPPGHTHASLTPIYRARGDFQTTAPAPGAMPLCYGLPASKSGYPGVQPLKNRLGQTVAYVWHNPQSVLALDFGMKQAAGK